MIANVFLVTLNFQKPNDYDYRRLQKLWKDQEQLAKELGILDSLYRESNRYNFISYTVKDEIIRFMCDSKEAAIEAQRQFKALMKNRGYKQQEK